MKLRLAHCIETCGSGGVEQARLILARQLDPNRFEQILICTQALGALPPLFEKAGCPIHEIGVFRGPFDRKRYAGALRILKEFRPHIVHGAVYEGVQTAAVAGRLAGAPIIIGEETGVPVGRRWSGRLLYRMLASAIHQMVGVSPEVSDYLTNINRLPARKVKTINNGVAESAAANPERLEALRRDLGIPPGVFVIGTVSRLQDRHKRTSDIIRALPKILHAFPECMLLIVGDGPDAGMLRELATSLRVAEKVVFAGYQEETRPYYELMDVFVLASAYEGLPLVLLEAMFAELPVVVTRVGGNVTVVRDGRTGFLIEPEQPTEIANQLIRLAERPELRSEMGRAGRARARAEFSSERYVAEVEKLYLDMARARSLI